MAQYFLISLLQLLAGVSIPLHTVRYGRMKVPIVLHYQMESDSSQLAVAPCWTLRIGEDACVEDDAGNKIILTPEGIFWPKGVVKYSISEGRVNGFTVLDSDSAQVCRVVFETDEELRVVRIVGRDTTEVRELMMEYAAPAMLHSIKRMGGGSVEFDFVHNAGRMLKRLVCRKDADGRVIGVSEYTFGSDSLGQTVTETVGDGQTIVRKVVCGFNDGQLRKREEYAGNGRLKRSTLYSYSADSEHAQLESVTATCYSEDSLMPTYQRTRGYKYAAGQPYPIEVETTDSDGTNERKVFTYPFCPSQASDLVADALLDRGMEDVVLSVSRWKKGTFVDSTAVVYDAFPAVNAPSGTVLRPSAIVYSDGELQNDICLKYTAYDTLGLRTSRAKVIHKRIVDRLQPEFFRWRAPNPLADLMREQRAYEVCAAWPDMTPNQDFGENHLFEGTGAYLGKVETKESKGCVIVDLGFGEAPLSARFSDPDITPRLIDGYTDLELVSPETAEACIDKAGGFKEGNHGLFKGARYLLCESRFGHRLDFATNNAYDIYPNVLYLTEAGPLGKVVHDNYNFGNYLWGVAAREAGIPQWMALLGSHLHAFFSPYSFGSFDSRDDIFSIRAGYHWDGK